MKFIIKKPITLEDKNLEQLLSDLLTKIQLLVSRPSFQYIMLEPLTKEPTKKFNGMIVYFQNVGGKTGFYGYENGSWVKL